MLYANAYDLDQLEADYRKDYYRSADDPRIQKWIDMNARVWLGLVEDVRRAREPVTKLLDIGAGTGGFLEAFHKASPQTSLAAVEASPEARENLRNRLPDFQFPVDTADAIADIDETYEVITLLQTLEHVFDPLTVCRQIHDLLTPGGVFLVTVPNRYSYRVLRRGTSETWCFSNSTHLQFFSSATLPHMLRLAGFKQVRRIKRFGGSEHTGLRAVAQYALRQLALSTELRFVALKQDGAPA